MGTAKDFAQFMSGLMVDVVSGAVSPPAANAACNAAGKLLRIVELQRRHQANSRQYKELLLK